MIKKDKSKNIMYVSNDLGYGAIKGDFDGIYIKQPSVYTHPYKTPSYENINLENETEVDEAMDSLLDHLDISINDQRYLVGNAAIKSLQSTTTVRSDSPRGKATGNSALILPLAFIAGRAIQNKYANDDEDFNLDEAINVNVNLTTALPISEAGTQDDDKRPAYVDRFTKNVHTVTVHSLGSDIIVRVKFDKVVVLKEGQIATSTSIQNGQKDFVKYLINKVEKEYPDKKDEAENLILRAKNYISVDIGQQTCDMALFNDGAVNDFSYSIPEGMGDLIDEVYRGFSNPLINKRESLIQTWENEQTEPILQELQKKIDDQIKKHAFALQDKIIDGISDLILKNPSTEVVFVFGGGSIPLAKYGLLDRIKERIQQLQAPAVVVWVGKEHAQNMNEEALKAVSDYMKAQQAQRAQQVSK